MHVFIICLLISMCTCSLFVLVQALARVQRKSHNFPPAHHRTTTDTRSTNSDWQPTQAWDVWERFENPLSFLSATSTSAKGDFCSRRLEIVQQLLSPCLKNDKSKKIEDDIVNHLRSKNYLNDWSDEKWDVQESRAGTCTNQCVCHQHSGQIDVWS